MSAPRVDVFGLPPGELVDKHVVDRVASRLRRPVTHTHRAAGLRQVLADTEGDR